MAAQEQEAAMLRLKQAANEVRRRAVSERDADRTYNQRLFTVRTASPFGSPERQPMPSS
jgi:hypothetical protein